MKIKKGMVLKHLGKETILYGEDSHNVNFSEVISLNDSAVLLVEHSIDTEFTLDEWADMLVVNYGIDRSQAMKDATRLLEKMREANLIEE